MKDGLWYTISGWMGNRLELRGNDLICFAVIYGFSMDGESQFKGNLDYLSSCMFATQPTTLLSLKHLLECNLILKQEEMVKGKKRCYYATNIIYNEGNFDIVDSTKEPLTMTTKESLANFTKESLPKNNNNKENKKDKNKFLSKKVEEGSLFPEGTDEKEKNYLEHMYEHYPLIMKMDKPLTYAEFKTLRENFDVDLVWDKMDNLENTKNMRKKYVSAYLTLNNWCKSRFNQEPKKKEDEQ